jgi:hypothetical protein
MTNETTEGRQGEQAPEQSAPMRSESSQFTARYVGDYYGIADQQPGETDSAFRHRVAGALRDAGRLIEAHEVQQGCRWDDPNGGKGVLTGVTGAIAQTVQGADYHVSGEQQVGADIAAGAIVEHERDNPPMTPAEALLIAAMFGGR